jgi:hypothetical protein
MLVGLAKLCALLQSPLPVQLRSGEQPGAIWCVDPNVTTSGDGTSWITAFKTMAEAFAAIASGDTILVRGNVREQLTTPTGVADVTILGVGTRPRHADTHPLNGEKATATWRIPASGSTDNPLLILRNPGWRIENILFAAHSTNYALRLERTADEDETEQDASHLSVIGCRFASGAGGINDTGGCADVLVENCLFEALTGYCIRGVGNIGAGQGWWNVLGNHFTGFTNGVHAAFYNSVIKGNCFTDGGTPGTTVVLNTVNALHGNNFVVDNYFQTATANFNDPDIVGNATDTWNNVSIDGTANMIGREVGQPA